MSGCENLKIHLGWIASKNVNIFKWLHVFPRDNIRRALTFMHNSGFENSDTLLFALLACIICI